MKVGESRKEGKRGVFFFSVERCGKKGEGVDESRKEQVGSIKLRKE